MKNLVAFSILVFSIFSVQARHSYYPTDIKVLLNNPEYSGEELRKTLFTVLVKKHVYKKGKDDVLVDHCGGQLGGRCYTQRVLGYKGARKVLFGKLHLDEDSRGYFIKDVYCQKEFTRTQTKLGPRVIPNNNVLNCEHTWPQSRFNRSFSASAQKSDLHHLYPTDSKANSKRGNYKFAEVGGNALKGNCSSSRFGRGDDGQFYFEPPQVHKGNVARSIFYFSIRYNMKLDPVQEKFLKEWHREDPVDSLERERHEGIFNVQGNRNPFIDYPELAERISDF